MTDFWASSGWHLLHHDDNADLEVTPAFVAAYFQRPELLPDETANDAERNLHASLSDDPMKTVSEAEIAALGDPDIIHNYRVMLGFRDLLIESRTLQNAYLTLARGKARLPLPSLFMDQLAHAILRQILNGTPHPMRARAAEIFFREQVVSTDTGRVMLADQEVVEMYAQSGGLGGIGQLLAQSATPMRQIDLDVLDDDNSAIYWERSDQFDTVVDFRFTQPALDAFARVMEQWTWHFLKVEVDIQPMQRIEDQHWRWHVGLDSEATRMLNALYNGVEPAVDEAADMIALFSLRFRDDSSVIADMRQRPVYLGLAMASDKTVRMKPQNLLVSLPLVVQA